MYDPRGTPQAEAWFHNAIADGLTMLIALHLPGTPPAETITLTLTAWTGALWPRQRWVQDTDPARIAAAFQLLAGTCERWPAPHQFRAALPPVPQPLHPQLAGPGLTREQMAINKARAQALLQQAREALLRKPGNPAASPPKDQP